MPNCGFCKSMILFGGVKDGPTTYCNQRCYQGAMLTLAASAVPPDVLDQAIREVHSGKCPQCGGAGPVDVHTSYFVWSALVMTGWNNTPALSCRSCGRKRQLGAMLGSAAVGWWGFPWGLIMTPVQVGRNIAAMTGGPHPNVPSPDLQRTVRMRMGALMISQTSAEMQGATPPTFPPTSPPTAPPTAPPISRR